MSLRGSIKVHLILIVLTPPLRSDRLLEHCSIALVGKYTKFSDSYASVIKALEHSALAISHKLEVKVNTTITKVYFINHSDTQVTTPV